MEFHLHTPYRAALMELCLGAGLHSQMKEEILFEKLSERKIL
jgi:hypothetical protein